MNLTRMPGGGAGVAWRAVLALAYARAGRVEEAHAELVALVGEREVAFDDAWLGTQIVLAEACSAVGDAETARLLGTRLEPYAGRIGLLVFEQGLAGSAFRALALLVERAGDPDAAGEWRERALAQARRLGAPALAVPAGHAQSVTT